MARPSGTIEPILLTLGLTMTSTVPPGRSRFTSIPEALRAWLLSTCPSGTKAIQFLTSRHSTLGPSERAEDKKTCGDANTGVCDVERWPGIFVDVKMQEIGHRPAKNSIGQISKDAAG